MLVVLSGLPGTGKTTIGKALAAKQSGTYIRVDEIEHALAYSANLSCDLGPAGYLVAFAIASSNLKVGNLVIADSVNPVPESRQGWHSVADDAGSLVLDVEVICSDEVEHRRRVEARVPDIHGFKLPTWPTIKARNYVPWTEPRLVVDTAFLSPADAVAEIEVRINALTRNEASGF
ncbi:AAA family ATPase [Skermanella mucosa]|uniref:AAA family ATPase n=1 Tax=Skermanella mucosa TaxID=1789672 RepID=UPI00192C2460|nr:AAA family ATPase [Skermanella mucosa]UEM19203.1 AAA family ATPase [Skermanella mucosa]